MNTKIDIDFEGRSRSRIPIYHVHYIVWITIVGVGTISVTKFVLQIKTMGDVVTWLGFIFYKA
jgi:hypothetical protein